MRSWLRYLQLLLAPPQFEDEKKSRQAALVYAIIASILGGALFFVFFIFYVLPEESYRYPFVIATIVAIIIFRVMLQSGAVRLTGLLLTVFLWLILASAAVTSGGIVSRGFSGFWLIIMLAGLIYGRKGAISTAIITALFGLTIVIAQLEGWFTPVLSISPVSWWFAQTIYFMVGAALLATATKRLDNAFLQRRRTEEKLVRSNERLVQHQAQLERLVHDRTAKLEHQYRRQTALAKIELAINRSVELKTTLQEIVEATTTYLPSSGGSSVVVWKQESESFLITASTVQDNNPLPTAQSLRQKDGVTHWIVQNGKPVVVSDIKEDPFGASDMLGESGLKAYAGIPMIVESKVIGVLYALDWHSRVYSADDLDFLTTLANRAAVAISRVQLYEKIEQMAARQERERLARDLHDVVSQTLFSSSIIAESLPLLWEKNPELVPQHLDDLHHLSRSALAEMRALLLELRPDDMDQTELGTLLHQLGTGFHGRTRIPVHIKTSETVNLPLPIKFMFYRITQEAFNNIGRHANADEVWIDLISSPQQTTLTIKDDGRGFNPDSVSANHLGLRIMHERAANAAAELQIESHPGQGTTIRCQWSQSSIDGQDIQSGEPAVISK